jgi:hypothetical protein
MLVYFQKDDFRRGEQRGGDGTVTPGTEIPVLIHGRYRRYHNVRLYILPEQAGHIPVIAGHHVGNSGVNGLPGGTLGEPGNAVVFSGELRTVKRECGGIQQAVLGDVVQLAPLDGLGGGFIKAGTVRKGDVGSAHGPGAEIAADGLVRRGLFFGIQGLQRFQIPRTDMCRFHSVYSFVIMRLGGIPPLFIVPVIV